MNKREKDLLDLNCYTEDVDKELTLILQSLQWDRHHLLQGKAFVKCKFDTGHTIPGLPEKHEEECFLKMQGYMKGDMLLPDPSDPTASTLVKLSNTDIRNIINIANTSDPYLRRGVGCEGPQPLTLERLQATYSADERRAIHNAVVATAPACHDLSDLTLPSNEPSGSKEPKSRLEILTELRNMKRRRMKYRVAAKSCNYSDVLRDVIKSQMELYTGVKSEPISSKPEPAMPAPIKIKQEYSPQHGYEDNSYGEDNFSHRDFQRESRHTKEERVRIKREPEDSYDRHHSDREYSKDKYRGNKERDSRRKSRDRDRRPYVEEYHQERESKYNTSRDKKETYYGRDKNKSNDSHRYSGARVKEQKHRRQYDYDSYDDYKEKKRR